MSSLAGKKALVLGIANRDSIAYGCARAFRDAGANLAVTYINEKAERFVRPVAEELGAELILPYDAREEDALQSVFDQIAMHWNKLDIALHSIAFCPPDDLNGRTGDASRAGFLTAMDVSVYSFIEMTRLAEPLMIDGGTCFTISYRGAETVIPEYGVMGPVKAALESTTRYLANDVGAAGIRVHALSTGPVRTRAASGIKGFDDILARSEDRAPLHRLATLQEIGAMAAFLASDAAAGLTGGVHYIDAGENIVG